MTDDLSAAINLHDLERLARQRLPAMVGDYVAGGAADEHTLGENQAAWRRLSLHYRVLTGAAPRSLATTVLGHEVALPVLIAPTAFHRLVHPDGELATARAAGAAGTIMVLSTLSTCAVEDVVAAAPGPVWFQLYVYRDRAATESLVRRAEAAGCRALVLTVDAPVLGRRESDVKNQFHLPPGIDAVNLLGAGYERVGEVTGASGLASYASELIDPAISWGDLDWLCATTRLPVLVKGVVRADDAGRAVEHGAAGVIVSNHGGRQLDGAPATAEVLARVVDAVAGRAEVLVDGGVRRGTDVVKALALGARAVLLGRPVVWGLALGGQAGVEHALELLRREFDEALALCGCRQPADVTGDLLDGGPA